MYSHENEDLMPLYVVTSRATGEPVYRYNAEAPIEWTGFEFGTFNHIADPADDVLVAPTPTRQVWSVLEFHRRFTQSERLVIRATRQHDPLIDDFQSLLEQASDVRSDDPDLIAALGYLTHLGLLEPGRAVQILGGA